jgi:hypothetical protein
MGGYSNVKRRRIKKFVRWLENNKQVEVEEGSKHTRITCLRNGNSTLAPTRHAKIDQNLVESLVKWLVVNEICSKEECANHLK